MERLTTAKTNRPNVFPPGAGGGTRPISGPTGALAAVRGALHIQRDLLSYLSSLAAGYADEALDPIRFNIMGRQMYLLLNPAHVARLLRDHESFVRPLAYLDVFRSTLGFSAVTVPDEEWRSVRKRTMAYFEVPRLHAYG